MSNKKLTGTLIPKDNKKAKMHATFYSDKPIGSGDSEIFDEYINATDAQRNTALANVSNQTANSTTGKMGYKVLDPAKTFAEQVTTENTIYEIKDVFDLGGNSFTVPTGCTLKFNGGLIKNGTLTGQGTSLVYNNKCLDTVILNGNFWSDKDIIRDDEVFTDNTYNTNRIKSLFAIKNPSDKIAFAKNTYTDISSITLTRNIDVDFGGSTINLHIEDGLLSSNFLFMESHDRDYGFVLDFVKVKNVLIVGNEDVLFDTTTKQMISVGTGIRRRCIQLFNVRNVCLENIDLSHFENGTILPDDYDRDWVKRYWLASISIFHYNNCYLDNIKAHECNSDNIIVCVPIISDTNYFELKNSTLYRCYTGLIQIVDGKCFIHDNVCKDCTSSAMNVFCYESEICNNTFDTIGDCIDTSEFGLYFARNVNIRDNIINNGGGIHSDGRNITISDNVIKTYTTDGGYGINLPSLYTTSHNPIPLQYTNQSLNNPLGTDKAGNIVIANNDIHSLCCAIRKNSGGDKNPMNNVQIINNRLVCTNDTSTSGAIYNPINIGSAENVTISNNYIDGCARTTFGTSYSANIMLGSISNPNLSGDIIISDNIINYPDTLLLDNNTTSYVVAVAVYGNSNTNFNLSFLRNIFKTKNVTLNPFFIQSGVGNVNLIVNNNINNPFLSHIYDITFGNNVKLICDNGYYSYTDVNSKPLWYNGKKFTDSNGFPPMKSVGSTDERPIITNDVIGYTYYDNTIKKLILANYIEDDYSSLGTILNTDTEGNFANNITQGTAVRFRVERFYSTKIPKIYFAKTSGDITDAIEIPITKYSGNGYSAVGYTDIVIAPDNSVYPYIYVFADYEYSTIIKYNENTLLWTNVDGTALS